MRNHGPTLAADDRLAILDLYGSYARRFDGGDAQGWAALFAPNGTFVIGDQAVIEGRDALAAFVRRQQERSPGVRHFVSNITLAPDSEGVLGTAAVLVLRLVPTEVRILNVGGYEDLIVSTDAGWRFQRRTFIPWLSPELVDLPVSLG